MHSEWIPSGHVDASSLMAIDVRTYDEGDLIAFDNYQCILNLMYQIVIVAFPIQC